MYEYGCIMLYLSIPNWIENTYHFDDSLLYNPDIGRYGIECNPHITILYGIHSEVCDSDVVKLFEHTRKSDFDIKIKGINCFYNEEYDVLKLDVTSEKLVLLNGLCRNLPHTDLFKDYKPHITIGYFIKGGSDQYINQNSPLDIINIEKIVYSKPNGEKVVIDLL